MDSTSACSCRARKKPIRICSKQQKQATTSVTLHAKSDLPPSCLSYQLIALLPLTDRLAKDLLLLVEHHPRSPVQPQRRQELNAQKHLDQDPKFVQAYPASDSRI